MLPRTRNFLPLSACRRDRAGTPVCTARKKSTTAGYLSAARGSFLGGAALAILRGDRRWVAGRELRNRKRRPPHTAAGDSERLGITTPRKAADLTIVDSAAVTPGRKAGARRSPPHSQPPSARALAASSPVLAAPEPCILRVRRGTCRNAHTAGRGHPCVPSTCASSHTRRSHETT